MINKILEDYMRNILIITVINIIDIFKQKNLRQVIYKRSSDIFKIENLTKM